MSLNSFNKLSSLKRGVKVIQGDIRSYLWFYALQENVNFENFIKFKLNNNAHLLVTNDDDLQIFIVIDNEVVIETDSYINGLFSYFGVHYVFNLEYPKKLKFWFRFLEEYVFNIPQSKRPIIYTTGVRKLLPR